MDRAETILALLDVLYNQYGGVESYITSQCRLEDLEIELISSTFRMSPKSRFESMLILDPRDVQPSSKTRGCRWRLSACRLVERDEDLKHDCSRGIIIDGVSRG